MKKLLILPFTLCAFLTANAETLNVPLQKSEDNDNGSVVLGKRSLVDTPTCIIDTDGEMTISTMGEVNSVSISNETGAIIFDALGNDGCYTYSIPALSQGNYTIEVEIDEVTFYGEITL